jgi:hypothetical protein
MYESRSFSLCNAINLLRKCRRCNGILVLCTFLTAVHDISYLTFSVLQSERDYDSSVGIATGYGVVDRGSVRLPAGAGNFFLRYRVQNGSEAHPASYPMGTEGSFPRIKRPGREANFASIKCRGQECLKLYLHSPIRLHGVVLS